MIEPQPSLLDAKRMAQDWVIEFDRRRAEGGYVSYYTENPIAEACRAVIFHVEALEELARQLSKSP